MTGVSGAAASGGLAFADVPTGPGLVALLASTATDGLDDHDLLELLAAAERASAWLASLQLRAAADFARRPARVESVHDDPRAVRAARAPLGRCVREFAADEIAARLRVSGRAAARRIHLGCALTGLPATASALHSGRIDVARAQVVVDEVAELDRDSARAVDRVVAEYAEGVPAARLRPKVRRAVLAADPSSARTRETRARCERRVVVTPVADGMAELWALLPAHDAVAVDRALGAAARSAHSRSDETRTTDQCRADELVARLLGSVEGERGTGEIQVTVAATTLLGLDDQPASLAGYGPITAGAARELARDLRWRRILTDPASGAVLDVGRTTYRPPAELARHVQVRDQLCTFPGCGWPALACDLDHTVAYPTGPTSAANLSARCRRHHRLKHTDQVEVSQEPDGTTHWVLPTGHTYDVPPPALGQQRGPRPDTDPPRPANPP